MTDLSAVRAALNAIRRELTNKQPTHKRLFLHSLRDAEAALSAVCYYDDLTDGDPDGTHRRQAKKIMPYTCAALEAKRAYDSAYTNLRRWCA